MRIASILIHDEPALAVRRDGRLFDVTEAARPFGGSVHAVLAAGALGALERAAENAREIDPSQVRHRPLLPAPGKIVCLGLNYREHADEAQYERPSFPVLFLRAATSLLGHGEPIVMPRCSTALDYEGEMAAVVGRRGRHIARADALAYVAGYSVFNDASIRDWQKKTHQWTIGKNFDGTGAFGPELVTADELPPGAAGLRISTRVNGEIVQDARTDQMIFDVAETISILSEAMTLEPGDVLVMGTPSGVGAARTPPRFLAPGDVCEIEIERIGRLVSPIAGSAAPA
ncbi:Fumarylacetoacetate hydrolase family protein [Minicystis rosea]|nr:Fumarylacetoacetate hydrolase family protein [Minicystis rosea]